MKTHEKRYEKQKRLEKANQLIQVISEVGRKFFNHNGRLTRFKLDPRGRVWLLDAGNERRIYAHYRYGWRGFSEGGTLEAMCRQLVKYISKNKLLYHKTFGPFPDWLNDGDPWGYGKEAMEIVRKKAVELGITAPSADDEARAEANQDAANPL
jgi:hypothetical protein